MPKLPLTLRKFLRKLEPPEVLWRSSGFLMIKAMQAWMASLHLRVARYEMAADPAAATFQGPVIFVFWHEYIPFPIYTRPHCNLAMLLSQHQDAEILSHVADFAGLDVVRGSTSRGGTAALRELMQHGQGLSLAMTPDGPRGPRRQLAQGCVYLSSRLQLPIVPLGFGLDRPWRNTSSWDHFAFPRPFSRGRAILGPRIQVPPDLSREDIELHRRWIQQQLRMVTQMAEDWAERRWLPRNSAQLVPSIPPMKYLLKPRANPDLRVYPTQDASDPTSATFRSAS